jgi:polar amino acid transport system substrate-binding protein
MAKREGRMNAAIVGSGAGWRAKMVSAAAGALLLALVVPQAQAAPKTLEPGVLNVGLNGDMPMTSVKDDKLIGSDGEIMNLVAERLGLKVKTNQMEWSALIQSTKQGKLDVMHGAMGWIKPRTEIMLLSDPVYYFGTTLAQKKAANYSTFADMKGKKVGTVTGFTLVPELKTVEGIGEVKLYDTSDGALQDLLADRVDIVILDPPLIDYAALQHPEWGIHQVELKPDMAKYPIMSTKYNVIFGVNKDEKELADAMNAEIQKMWANCENVKIMAKYGLRDASWFTPPDPNPRIGVDRDANWKSPDGKDCLKTN